MPPLFKIFAISFLICLSAPAVAQQAVMVNREIDPFNVFRGLLLSPEDSVYPKNGEGSLIRLKDGRLLHMVSRHMQGTGGSDFWPAIIAQMYSSDNGITWTKPTVVFSHSKGVRTCMQPSLVRLSNGELGVAYSKYDSPQSAVKVFRYSKDEGNTWSSEILMSPSDGYFSGAHHRALVLSGGRIIFPLHTKIGNEKDGPIKIFTRITYSDDQGRTWKMSQQVVGTNDVASSYQNNKGRAAVFAEATVAELPDGDVVMLARTIAGYLYYTVSKDKGITWADTRPTNLVSPASSLNLVKLPDSNHLMVVWQSCCMVGEKGAGKRLSLSSAISEDGGKTWNWPRELVNVSNHDGNVQYPTITVDGTNVMITYRAVKNAYLPRWVMEEHLLVYPLEWFYAEKNYNGLTLQKTVLSGK